MIDGTTEIDRLTKSLQDMEKRAKWAEATVQMLTEANEDLGLSLHTFRRFNVLRCVAAFHPLDAWTPTEWALAMIGEAGEVCNAVKKLNRGDGDPINVGRELADVVTYCDLLAARLGIDLSKAVKDKFNEVSERRGCKVVLP